MKRRCRIWTSRLAIFAMLFAQLAVAAYACPALSPDKGPVTAAFVASPCQNMAMDKDLANLCQKHCHDDQQSQGGLAPAVGFVPSFIVELDVQEIYAPATVVSPPALSHAIAPPLIIRNCCFRI